MNQSHPFSTEVPKTKPLVHMREISALLVFTVAIVSAVFWWYLHPFRRSNELLHVSFDAAHDTFQTIDPAFEEQYLRDCRFECKIRTQTAGSIRQAKGIATGLIADVASFASPMEVIQIQQSAVITETDWDQKCPFGSSPFYSTIVWLIKPEVKVSDNRWSALLSPDIHPCMADSDTSGAGRYAYFAILAGFHEGTLESISRITPKTDQLLMKTNIDGDRASEASRLFMESNYENVLITWESEAIRIRKKFPDRKLTIVYPQNAIATRPVVIKLGGHTEHRGTSETADAYLSYLFSDAAQRCFAEHGFRPRNSEILNEFSQNLPPMELIDLESMFGSWEQMLDSAFAPNHHYAWIKKIREAKKGGEE